MKNKENLNACTPGSCPSGQTCMNGSCICNSGETICPDNKTCCPTNETCCPTNDGVTTVCCPIGNECVNNACATCGGTDCVAPNTICYENACYPPDQCFNENSICCDSGQTPYCNGTCCAAGQCCNDKNGNPKTCNSGSGNRCCPDGSLTPSGACCDDGSCPGGNTCLSGTICCAPGQVNLNGQCCNNICNGQCCNANCCADGTCAAVCCNGTACQGSCCGPASDPTSDPICCPYTYQCDPGGSADCGRMCPDLVTFCSTIIGGVSTSCCGSGSDWQCCLDGSENCLSGVCT